MQEKVILDGKEITLVGTVHVSPESVQEVRETIEREHPDTVGVELCEKRYELITERKQWEEQEVFKIIREGKTYLFLANLLLSRFQKKVGEELGSEPGAEMIEAIKIAEEHGIPVTLLDREISTTLRRAWHAMGIGEKLKLIYALLGGLFVDTEEVVEELKDHDVITELMEELAEQAPGAKKALIDERDQYIASKIREAEGSMVAVVGAGHLSGIVSLLQKDKISREGLDDLPQGRSWFKIIGYAVPVIFVSLVLYAFVSVGLDMTLHLLWLWFLINGSLSALGVILALGHPLSIVAAFLAAPFTSLNPALAAGWFAGVVEMYMRKPRVVDLEALKELNELRDFYRNRVTRTLLVIAFANVGSTIGTLAALPYIMQLLYG
ncbi:MAG: TraB/GumN family protein [Theionarchaea archaeon]|nr:TraB/GumN family protein [Theionarchaea archaeon]